VFLFPILIEMEFVELVQQRVQQQQLVQLAQQQEL
jgi:hypothetical protein